MIEPDSELMENNCEHDAATRDAVDKYDRKSTEFNEVTN